MKKPPALKCLFGLLTALLLLSQNAYSQDNGAQSNVSAADPLQTQIDSVLNLVALQSNDAQKAKLYNALVHIPSMPFDRRIEYARLSLRYCSPKNTELLADNYNQISYSYYNLSKFKESIEYSKPLLDFYQKLKRPERVALINLRIADSYDMLQQPDSMFFYSTKALQEYENIDDSASIAYTYFNIGTNYDNLGLYITAEEYYRKAIAIDSAAGNEFELARDYFGIGRNYISRDTSREMVNASIPYLKKAADYFETVPIDYNAVDDDAFEALCYKNISFYYLAASYIGMAPEKGKVYADSCGIYLAKVGTFFEDFGLESMAFPFRSVKVDYLAYNKRYDEAIAIMLEWEERLNNGEFQANLPFFYDKLYHLYFQKGDYKNACAALNMRYEKRILEVNDSLLASAAKAQTEQALIYERKITNAEKRQMRITIISLISGLFLVLILVCYIFRLLNIRKKANVILSEQKEEIQAQRDRIDEQNQSIQASINYARRIQRALLTPDEAISRIFHDHFLIYEPRNVVSGDFYWVGQFGDNKVCIVADCTGHGVPGGFMSVLGMTNLNYIVGQELTPDAILNKLRESIMWDLRQSEGDITAFELNARVLDGMDAAVYVVNERQMTLSFAGANNPLLLIRDNEALVIKPDSMPVGVSIKMTPFKSVTMELHKGDCLYTYSDGFQDQFSVEAEKKFQKKHLRDLLLEIHDRPMDEQKKLLTCIFEEWRGPAENQTDDVVIMGVRI